MTNKETFSLSKQRFTSQNGFSAVFLLVILLVIFSLIGGYFYKTQYLDKVVSKNTEIHSVGRSTLAGRVLFVSKKGDINIADPDGKNIAAISSDKQFHRIGDDIPPIIISISPDESKIIFGSHIKYDLADPNNPDYRIGNGTAYYISSADGKNVQKIDLTKFTKLGAGLMVFFASWSVDGSKIVFRAQIPQPGSIEAKSIFGDYDPVTEEIRSIYTLDSPKAGYLMYYDSQKGILVFSGQLPGKSDPINKAYKINLQTQKIEEFTKPTLIPSLTSSNSLYDPYFVSSNVEIDSTERKEITIYSYDQPNSPIAKISIDDSKSDFSNNYVWSPKSNYLAIVSGLEQEKDGTKKFTRTLNIYSRSGKKIISKPIINSEYYSGSLFSPDESKFLMVGLTTLNDGPKIDIPIWQVIDTKTGTQLSDKVISEDLAMDTVKWLK